MNRITTLSPAAGAALPAVRDEWLAAALSTAPADRAGAEAGVRAAYRAAGLAPPRWLVWLESPFAGAVGQAVAPDIIAPALAPQRGARLRALVRACEPAGDLVLAKITGGTADRAHAQAPAGVAAAVNARVRAPVAAAAGQVWATVHAQVHACVQAVAGEAAGLAAGAAAAVRAQLDAVRAAPPEGDGTLGELALLRLSDFWHRTVCVPQWADWHGWLAAMKTAGVTGLEPAAGLEQAARSAGWWWPYRHFAVLTGRPELLERDGQGRLHAGTGPAVRYRDGWGFHAWHGRAVPAWVTENPTLGAITAERDVRVRRAAIESMGWGRFAAAAGLPCRATLPDPDGPGQTLALYDVPEQLWGSRATVLVRAGRSPGHGGHRQYGLAVPAEVTDPAGAAAWAAAVSRDEHTAAARRT